MDDRLEDADPPVFLVWRTSTGAGMTRAQLRRSCTALVASLEIPDPFDIDVFCAQLGRRRGRPVRRMPRNLASASPCGLLVSTDDADFIIYEQRTSPVHQLHILLHEVGHLLLAHDTAPVLAQEACALLLPDLDPALVQRILARTHYSQVEEQEAELVASLILERVSRWTPQESRDVPAGARDVIIRVEQSLAGRWQAGARNHDG